jgi:hypothetical protein
LRALFVLMFIVAGLCAAYASFRYWYIKTHYPYGWSHCCDIGLSAALERYAYANGGMFPANESCPEASLSLLYPTYIDEDTLRGKTVSLEVVEKQLKQGKKLGLNSCGWHHVEGLTNKDDPRLALVWDKVGLGHNGEVLSEGGHFVIFVGGQILYIKEKHWADFEEIQKMLLLEKKGNKLLAETSEELQKKWMSIYNEN